MTPFLQLRLWWGRAPQAARLASGLSVAIVLSLTAYLLVPTGGDSSEQATGVDAGAGAAVAEPGTSTTLAPTAGTVPGGAPVATTAPMGATSAIPGTASGSAPVTAADEGCAPVPTGTPGIDDKTVTVAAALLELAGPIGNSAAGLASPDELKRMAETVANDVNASGGVRCRKLQIRYYKANPLNQDTQRAACLQMIQDRPFMGFDLAGFATAGAHNCLPQQKVPFVAITSILPSEIQRFQPYLATASSDLGTSLRTAAYALRDRGWFDPAKGFKKLGLLEDDCMPEAAKHLDAALAKVGITSAQISKFTFPCPTGGFAPPNQMSQAVTQHRLAGVTHVIPITGGGSFNTYTEIAQGQGYKPKYALTDYQGIILTEAGSLKANAENFDRTIAITTTLYGQESTPGMKQNPGTLRCQALLVKAGFAPDYVFQKGGGIVCSMVWTVVSAIEHARSLTRLQALPGLFDAGPVQLAWPLPDATYRPPLKLAGGDTWWPIEYQRECGCWHVIDAHRRPSSSA